jgi:hypothetical protein
MAQVAEHLSSKQETLSSNSQKDGKKKKKQVNISKLRDRTPRPAVGHE